MNTNSVKEVISKPMVVGGIALAVGILLGVAAEKYGAGLLPATRSISSASVSTSSTTKALPRPPSDPFDKDDSESWDPFREMRTLQTEMDEMFRRSVARFRMSPQLDIFHDDAGYSLSLDVRELKDRFEVRAYLPDIKASEAKVKLDGNRLEVEVTHREMEKREGTNAPGAATAWGRHTQVVELAGKLKADQMKVDHKEHELLITIPKA